MSNILPYNLFKYSNGTSPRWLDANVVNEGIYFTCDTNCKNPNVEINWDKDSQDDIVKLANVQRLNPSRMDGMQTFGGYVLDDPNINGIRVKKCFAEWSKRSDSLTDQELKDLISYTYSDELRNQNVTILFAMGSSSSLSVRIAEALKEMYYPKAKIIDIMKAYYGIDPNNIIDWDEYHASGPVQQAQIDSYLKSLRGNDPRRGEFEYKNPEDFDDLDDLEQYLKDLEIEKKRLEDIEKKKFKGYIKKGGSLQTGRTRDKILKPGHMIDSYVIDSIIEDLNKWKEDRSSLNPNMAIRMAPRFLTVDDIIVQGSTIKRSMSILREMIYSKELGLSSSDREQIIRSLYGYVLFSYSTRFTKLRDQD